MHSDLQKYVDMFASLHVNKQYGKVAPHKAVMLLSVMDLVEMGEIDSNRVVFSNRLEDQFHKNWSRYVGLSDVFKPNLGTPFWHLHREPFWHLVPFEGGDEDVELYFKGNPYSPGTTRRLIKYAVMDNGLFEHMRCYSDRLELRTSLIKNYF